MKKTYSVLIVCIFVLFLAAVSVGSVVAPERTFSQMENRVLKTAPKLTEQAVMDGSYMRPTPTASTSAGTALCWSGRRRPIPPTC